MAEYRLSLEQLRITKETREGGGRGLFTPEDRHQSTRPFAEGFVDAMTAKATALGGRFETTSEDQHGGPGAYARRNGSRVGELSGPKFFPQEVLTVFTDYQWLFTDLKEFIEFAAAAIGIYVAFKPEAKAEDRYLQDRPIKVFVHGKQVTVKPGDDVAEIVRRMAADDVR